RVARVDAARTVVGGQAGGVHPDADGRDELETSCVDDRYGVRVGVGREDPVGGRVEGEVDRLLADRHLDQLLVRLLVDDRHEVVSRTGDVGAAASRVDGDALGIEPDGNLGDRPARCDGVDPAGGADGEVPERAWILVVSP